MINKKIYNLSVVLLLVLFGLTSLFAGDAARIGTAAGVQVLVPVGARDMAMGGADLANTKGLDAIFWNPAGLSRIQYNAAAQFSTMNMFNDIRVNYLALGFKTGRFGTIGVSLKAFDFGEIPWTTNEDMDGLAGRTYSPSFITAGVTFSRMLTDAIQFGLTGKIVSESIPRASASAFAFDFGLQYHGLGQIEGLALGLMVKNIGTNMKYDGSGLIEQAQEAGVAYQDYRGRLAMEQQLPSSIEMGVSYSRAVAEDNTLMVSGLFQNNNYDNDRFKIGLEYAYGDLVFLRGGYNFNQNVESEDALYTFSAGLGLHYNLGGTDLSIDYAYRDSQYFDGNSLFSLKVGF